MKAYKNISRIIFLLLVLTISASAQDINVQNMIGKDKDAVITKYGKPVYMDDSNTEMLCMFFKTNGTDITFVSDSQGIFQAEVRAAYSSQKKAQGVLDGYLKKAAAEKYSIDTVETNAFSLKGEGAKVEVQLMRNPITKQYNLNIKAKRSRL